MRGAAKTSRGSVMSPPTATADAWTMAHSQNVQRILATYDAVNDRDLDRVFIDVADDYVMVDHATGATLTGKAAAREWMEDALAASSDVRCSVINVFESGDTVVVQVRSEGTHDGVYAGFQPSGNRITFDQCEIYHLDSNGRIVEGHQYYDLLTMLTQMDAAPALGH